MKIFPSNEENYKEIIEVIDRRWEIQLYQPLHTIGYFLNLEVFYDKPEIKHDEAIIK